jgi:DNA-binding IclR family transcriptional regulator
VIQTHTAYAASRPCFWHAWSHEVLRPVDVKRVENAERPTHNARTGSRQPMAHSSSARMYYDKR